jgi:transcriptional regulator with XRE-family HTH domain
MEELQRVVSRNVRAFLGMNELSQGVFAASIGLTPAAISDKLHGRRKWSLEDLERIAETYRIDLRVLLTEAWRPAELPGEPNKVTFTRMSFRHFGRRDERAVTGGPPLAVAA